MLRLTGVTELNREMVELVNNDVLQRARVLLKTHGFVIFEEAIIRAKQRQHRHLVQWRALRVELQEFFGRELMSYSRNNFRQWINSQYEPLWDVPRDLLRGLYKEVADHLDRLHNSNQQAGFAFPSFNRMITERQIAARLHQAESFDRSAWRLRDHLDNPPLLATDREADIKTEPGATDREADIVKTEPDDA